MADWLTNQETETSRLVSLQYQSAPLSAHPLPMGRGGWPVGLQPLGGISMAFPLQTFKSSVVDPEVLVDYLSNEAENGFICDEDTQEPIGVEMDAASALTVIPH